MSNQHGKKDVHKELAEKMKEAGFEAQRQDSYTPHFDWSFKEKDSEPKKKSSYRIIKAAAVIVIVLLGANIIMLSMPNNAAYSEGGIIHRVYTGVTGLFTDSEENVNKDDVKAVLQTENWEDLDKFKKKLEQLHIPEYIPERYDFVEFNAEELYSGNYMGYYYFADSNGGSIYLTFNYHEDAESVYSDTSQGELIELEDRSIYIVTDEMEGSLYATVYTNEGTIDISGNCSKEELKQIAYGLKQ